MNAKARLFFVDISKPRSPHYNMDAVPSKDIQGREFRLQEGLTRTIDSELLLKQTFHNDSGLGYSLLYRLYFASLCSHAVRFVYSKEIAEDIVGEVFCRFWEDRIFERKGIARTSKKKINRDWNWF